MEEEIRQLLLSVFAADELLPADMLAVLDLLTAPDPALPPPQANAAI